MASGDGQGGLPGVGIPRGEQQIGAARPQPGPRPGRRVQPGAQPGEPAPGSVAQAEGTPACRGSGLDHRERAVGRGDQVAGPGERGDSLLGGRDGDRPGAQLVAGSGGGQAGPDAYRHAGSRRPGRAAALARDGRRGRPGLL